MPAMLKRCAYLLGLAPRPNKESRRKLCTGRGLVSADFSLQLKDYTVRIIHAGGREEKYQTVIPASELLKKYPGMCVARPEVFKKPHESLVWPEEKLFPGQKYYIIPSTTVQKLKRKYPEKRNMVNSDEVREEIVDGIIDVSLGGDDLEECILPAKAFYNSKEKWSRCSLVKSGRKKGFVPPLPVARSTKILNWEPSLTSIQELSP